MPKVTTNQNIAAQVTAQMGADTDRRAFLAGASLALVAGCVPRHVRGETDLVQKLDREVIALKQENARLSEQLKTCDSGTLPPPVIYTELRQVFARRMSKRVMAPTRSRSPETTGKRRKSWCRKRPAA